MTTMELNERPKLLARRALPFADALAWQMTREV